MSSKIEKLLQPRFQVIADYPMRPFNDNDIIEFTQVDFKGRPIYNMGVERDEIVWVKPEWFDTYPHLFRKLQWWECRKVNDMPQYLNKEGEIIEAEYKFDEEGTMYYTYNGDELGWYFNSRVQPATSKDFTTYTSNKTLKQ